MQGAGTAAVTLRLLSGGLSSSDVSESVSQTISDTDECSYEDNDGRKDGNGWYRDCLRVLTEPRRDTSP